jgi:HPt (histidine-containing phosphotransfer) domain-containing protein
MGTIAASAVSLQKLSRTAKQLEGAPLAEGESDAYLPKSDIALEEKAKELLEKLCATADRASNNVQSTLSQKRAEASEDPKALVEIAVMEAMNALVSTASNVIQASSAAQTELVSSLSTPATRAMYARDPQMAQGLVDACGQVNVAISSLSTGDISTITQHELIAQAENLSKACEVLAFAARAGTRSANSDAAKRILDAAKTVSDAVKMLVEAAKQVEDVPDVDDVNVEDYGIDPATLAEIRQMMKIVDLEKQLIKAKKNLERLEAQSKTAKGWNQ